LESYVKATFEPDRLQEPGYLRQYKLGLVPIIYEMAIKFEDIYIYFNPDLIGEAHDIWFIDSDGDGELDRVPEAPLEYYDDDYDYKAWFYSPILEGKPVWTGPYLSTLGLKYTFISYTRPLYMDNQLIAVIGTDFIFDELKEEIENFNVYDTGYAFLLNDQYDFLIHPQFDDTNNLGTLEDGKYNYLIDRFNESNSGLIDYTWINNEQKLLAFSHISNDWIVGVTVERSVVFEQLNTHIQNMILIIIAGILIASLIAMYLSRFISKPIEELSFLIGAIGKGDYDTPIPAEYIKDTTEIGTLARSIDIMEDRQKKSFQEIKEHNLQLDQMVQARTEELSATNEELIATLDDLKNTQDLLIETKKLEALSILVAGVAHRLNTPIGSALTSSSFLSVETHNFEEQFRAGELKKSTLKEYITRVKNTADLTVHNLEKANSILMAFKQLSVSYDSKETFEFNIKELFENNLSYLVDFIEGSPFDYFIECNEDISIISNPMHYSNILINLITHSVYYNFQGYIKGSIEIKIEHHNDTLFITYHDTGTAIQVNDIEKLFEPFSISRLNQKGSGIELHLVYNIITKGLHGHINYDTQANSFNIEIPNIKSIKKTP